MFEQIKKICNQSAFSEVEIEALKDLLAQNELTLNQYQQLLRQAIYQNKTELVALFIDHTPELIHFLNSSAWQGPLHYPARYHKDGQMLRLLVQKGFTLNQKAPYDQLSAIVAYQSFEVLDEILPILKSRNPEIFEKQIVYGLSMLVTHLYDGICEKKWNLLLHLGAQINPPQSKHHLHPLASWSISSQIDLVFFLLAQGANPDLAIKSDPRFLEKFIYWEKIDCLEAIFKVSKDPLFLIQGYQNDLLEMSARTKKYKLVTFFLSYNADINCKRFENRSALDLAYFTLDQKLFETLGVQPDQKRIDQTLQKIDQLKHEIVTLFWQGKKYYGSYQIQREDYIDYCIAFVNGNYMYKESYNLSTVKFEHVYAENEAHLFERLLNEYKHLQSIKPIEEVYEVLKQALKD